MDGDAMAQAGVQIIHIKKTPTIRCAKLILANIPSAKC